MKKSYKLLSLILSALMLVILFSGCSKQEENKELTKIRLNQVVRSIFYAPVYAAINQGFFKEEGLDIELSTGQGADATCTKTQPMW